MKIQLTKISNDQHKLRCVRSDGSSEEALLETKSLLVHDFTHLAYEIEAGLKKSFWGSVASGVTFAKLREEVETTNFDLANEELMRTEMIVGPLQGVMQGKQDAQKLLEALPNLFQAYGAHVPEHLTLELLERAQVRFKALMGEWTKLPFGDTMSVLWP